MRAAVFVEPGRIEVQNVDDPDAREGELLLEVAACGICGSDLDSYRHGAHVQPGQIMGHELAGRVLAGGEELDLPEGTGVTVRPLIPCDRCRHCVAGDYQLCDQGLVRGLGYGLPGGFAQQIRVPWPHVGKTVFPAVGGVALEDHALVEPLAVALRAVHRAEPGPSDVVVVQGLGPIGLGTVAMARLHGVSHVVAVDFSPLRREAASSLGADVVVAPEDAVEAVRQVTGPGGYGLGAAADVVIDCAGHPAAFRDAVKMTRHGGRMVLVAHSTSPYEVKPSRLIEKEIDLRGAYAYRHEFADVLGFLRDGRIDPDLLISHRIPLEAAAEAFELQSDPSSSLKVVLVP